MDIHIRFIGMIMMFQASFGLPYHAIIPKWQPNSPAQAPTKMIFCTNVEIPKHEAYVRVLTRMVKDDSEWAKDKDCDQGQNCTLYKIPDGSTLQVDGGFAPVAKLYPQELPCFVPHWGKESLATSPKLHKDVLTSRSVADFAIPYGTLTENQFTNDMIYFELEIDAPVGATSTVVKVISQPRGGGAPKVLVVEPGTYIDIVNMPPAHAGMDYNTKVSGPLNHFYFFHQVLDRPQNACKPFPMIAPCPTSRRRDTHTGGGGGTTMNLGCGGSGCC